LSLPESFLPLVEAFFVDAFCLSFLAKTQPSVRAPDDSGERSLSFEP